MIGYTMLGSNDLPRALAFYDGLLAGLGAKRIFGDERFQVYGVTGPQFGICKPYDGAPATAGNGTMIALFVPTREAVKSLHEKALDLGASDEGQPGPRGGDESPFYAAYFRDPDGNKLCFFNMPA